MNQIKDIYIKFIDHDRQRYKTAGDFFFEGETLHFRISKMKDWRYQMLVLYHEIRELITTQAKGITIEEIDAFDIQFEKDRLKGKHSLNEEPGHHIKSPYRLDHIAAEKDERRLAKDLKISWKEYDRYILSL